MRVSLDAPDMPNTCDTARLAASALALSALKRSSSSSSGTESSTGPERCVRSAAVTLSRRAVCSAIHFCSRLRSASASATR